MKTPLNIPSPNLLKLPVSKEEVLAIAQDWMNDDLVRVDIGRIAELKEVGDIRTEELSMEQLQPTTPLEDAAAFAIAMNSINYMFWEMKDGDFVRYERDGVVGALAMTQAFSRAWSDPESSIALARDTGRELSVSDITETFGPIPDPASRARILNEMFRPGALDRAIHLVQEVVEDPSGQFDTGMASKLADIFPQAYGDEVLKKSQLAVSMVWREAINRGNSSTCSLTAFADYQIPNVLRALGVLEYDPALARSIDRGELIEVGSPEEKAIRASSILAVEAIASTHGAQVADVDYWIWLKRKEPKTPFHLSETTLY